MKKIIFLYDKLMLEKEQKIVGIEMKFLSFAQTKAKLYWFDDDKRKRVFAIKQNSSKTSQLYGALYEVDYDLYRHKLHSYYYNMLPFTNRECEYDYYTLTTAETIPLRFKSLTQLQNNKAMKGDPVNALLFVGNKCNRIIEHNSARRYYKLHGIDTDSFLKHTKEKRMKHKEKRREKNELE